MKVKCACGAEFESGQGLAQEGLCPRCMAKVANSMPPKPPSFAVPPAPPGQAVAHRRTLNFILLGFVLAALLVLLVCGGIAGLVTYLVMSKRAEQVPISNCQTNLTAIVSALSIYANENQAKFPPLPATPGRLMFDASLLYPEYISESQFFVCPSTEGAAEKQVENTPELVSDACYMYLSHAVLSELEGLVLIDAYAAAQAENRVFGEDVPVAPGEGTAGSATLFALRPGVARLVAQDPLDSQEVDSLTSKIPVIVERPGHHGGQGGNVVYLDGHVEYVEFGRFPMSPAFINGLESVASAPETQEATGK